MQKEFFINLGNDGTCHYATRAGDDFLYYNSIEKGKTGKIDFFVDLRFASNMSFHDAIKACIEDFFLNQKTIEFNQIYERVSSYGELEILFDKNFPCEQKSVTELLLSKLGSLE